MGQVTECTLHITNDREAAIALATAFSSDNGEPTYIYEVRPGWYEVTQDMRLVCAAQLTYAITRKGAEMLRNSAF